MNLLAVTYATVFLLTAPCEDDVLKWDPVAADDMDSYRIYLNSILVATASPLASDFPLGCAQGAVCMTARDRAGNELPLAAGSCIQWMPAPGIFAEFGPCALGCSPLPGGFGELAPGCCVAPLTVED